mgnify:CR=1 FL=1
MDIIAIRRSFFFRISLNNKMLSEIGPTKYPSKRVINEKKLQNFTTALFIGKNELVNNINE